MSIENQHPFWGSLSPLGGLSGAGLLIMASARLAWAVTVAGGVIWVYTLSALAVSFLSSDACRKIFPVRGRKIIFTCLAYFFGSAYLLIFWLLCPFAALEVFLPLMLVPLFCASSSLCDNILFSKKNHPDIEESFSRAFSLAAVLSLLIIAFSIIREPLAYCSLSLPGTHRGIVKIISFKNGAFFPIGIFTSSAGALLLLGYFTGLYRYFKNENFNGEAEK